MLGLRCVEKTHFESCNGNISCPLGWRFAVIVPVLYGYSTFEARKTAAVAEIYGVS